MINTCTCEVHNIACHIYHSVQTVDYIYSDVWLYTLWQSIFVWYVMFQWYWCELYLLSTATLDFWNSASRG